MPGECRMTTIRIIPFIQPDDQSDGFAPATTITSAGATKPSRVSKLLISDPTSAQAAARTASEQSFRTARYAPKASCIIIRVSAAEGMFSVTEKVSFWMP